MRNSSIAQDSGEDRRVKGARDHSSRLLVKPLLIRNPYPKPTPQHPQNRHDSHYYSPCDSARTALGGIEGESEGAAAAPHGPSEITTPPRSIPSVSFSPKYSPNLLLLSRLIFFLWALASVLLNECDACAPDLKRNYTNPVQLSWAPAEPSEYYFFCIFATHFVCAFEKN